MDAVYLKRTVGPALSKALTSMVVDQPRDSVEYLGNFLIRFVEREEGKAAQADLFARATELAAAQEAAAAAAVEEAKRAEEEAKKPLPGQEELEGKLASTKEVPELYGEVLELVKKATGATSVYVGLKSMSEPVNEGDPPTPVITFLAGTDGSNMAGTSLVGQAEDDPDAPAAEGVTFGLFVGAEPAEVPEGADEEDEAAYALVYPDQVVVPNVVRNPKMKFFGVPSLGAYAAVPIKYNSCLHADGVGAADADDPAANGGEGGAAPAYVACEMVLGMHTMGQAGRQFSAAELGRAKGWAAKLAAAMERAELELWRGEVAKQEEQTEVEKEVGDAIAKAKADAAIECDEAVSALSEDMPPEDRDLEAKRLAYVASAKVLAVAEDKLKELAERRLPLKPSQTTILQAMLYTLIVPKEDFVDPSTRKVNWEKMRRLLVPSKLLKQVKKYDPGSEKNVYPRYGRVDDMRRMMELDDLPSEAVYGVIFDWITKATDVREAAVIAREAAAEAEAAAAAAGEDDE